jgi:pimeloyl-ACP methyl ester carboxylesterase
MKAKHCYVNANGIRQHYIDYAGEGPVLILMPGLTANARFFDGLIGAGLAPPLRVIAVDLRGRGETEQPDTGYSMAEHAADILALMDELGIEQVNLGGHSFGGLLTYYLAANFPERFSRCVVIDAPAEVHEGIVEQIQPSLDRLDATFESIDAYLDYVRKMPYFTEGWWDDAAEAYYRSDLRELGDGRVASVCRPEHIRQAVEATLEPDWPDLVSRIRQPTLLLRATDPFGPPGSPPILPADQAARTLARLPDGRLVELKGNHFTALFGAPARLASAEIVRFLAAE